MMLNEKSKTSPDGKYSYGDDIYFLLNGSDQHKGVFIQMENQTMTRVMDYHSEMGKSGMVLIPVENIVGKE